MAHSELLAINGGALEVSHRLGAGGEPLVVAVRVVAHHEERAIDTRLADERKGVHGGHRDDVDVLGLEGVDWRDVAEFLDLDFDAVGLGVFFEQAGIGEIFHRAPADVIAPAEGVVAIGLGAGRGGSESGGG